MAEHPIVVELSSSVRARLPVALLARAARETLRRGGVRRGLVELAVVGDRAMRAENARGLGHDYTTDVLSYSLGEDPAVGVVAQLTICHAFARRQAAQRGIAVREELVRYVVHGLLHVLGHDDHEDGDRARMWREQELIVARVMAG